VIHDIYESLTVLQHRGQDASGILTNHNGKITLRKSLGLVRDGFSKKHIDRLKGSIGIGAIVAIFILNYNILTSLIIYYNNANQFINVSADYIYLSNFLNSLPDFDEENERSKDKLRNTEYGISIELKNIYFKIESTNNKIYNDLNLFIPQNQNVVIMGSIGSGKSTFAKLLVRLQEPDKGKILLNGVNYNKLNIENVRKNIIYIPQTPILFDRTLWDNVSYGFKEGEIKKQDVLDVLRKMEMDSLAEIFKKRFDKPVGKKGSFLSGGQRQIVWVLRALFGKAKVIILDEPTSALDKESKINVRKMIRFLTRKRTLIIITHDMDLLTGMDRVIVFDKGAIKHDKKL